MNVEWKHEFPREPGYYWFAGERFRRNSYALSRGELPRYSLLFCVAHRTGNDEIIVVSEGTFLFPGELGKEWFFAPAEVPQMPQFIEPAGEFEGCCD